MKLDKIFNYTNINNKKLKSIMHGNSMAMRVVLTLVFALFALGISAQTVTGTVKDSTGEPVMQATVLEKGTSNGTVTDFDGNFTLKTQTKSPQLVISFIGMKTQTINVAGKSKISVVLEDEAHSLNDVVVIGYGTVRKKDLTGSVATVTGQDIVKVPVPSVSEALSGKLAGVRVTTTDGSPDAEVLIRVRGGGSITGDNSPLYVVDGFQTSSISDISPNDIEDITVLKDASSTAIYGSQGANGVILITTKNAKAGKTQINYNGYLQTKTIAKRLKAMNAYDYVMSNYEYALLRGSSNVSAFEQNYGVYDDLYLYKSVGAIDWQEDMFGANVLSHSHNLSLNGGTEKTKFSLSGTYDYNGGLMENNDFGRYAFMFKLNHDINKNLKFSMKANVSDQTVNGQGTQGGTYKIRTSQAITSVATHGLSGFVEPDIASMSDEEYQEYLQNNMSLSEQAQRYWRKRNNRKFGFSAGLDWTIIKGLKAHAEGGYEYGFNETKNWWGSTTTNASYEGGLPLAEWTKQNQRTVRESVNISYDKKFGEDHKVNFMVGQEFRKAMVDQNVMKGTRYSEARTPDNVFANFGMGAGVPTISSSVSANDVLNSYFGRFNYNFKERYLLTLTFREDGSSKFADGHRWGFFPAAAAAWRIIDEPWMEGAKDWLSNLKLRLSFGKVGNNRIASSTYEQLYLANSGSKRYGVGEQMNNDYSSSSVLANPYITWEKRTTRNIGLDFGFWNERINGSVEFYWNSTSDLLIQHNITAPGYTTVYENCGETSNKGVELSLNAAIFTKKNFTLNANFNIGFDKSNVDEIAAGMKEMTFASGWAGTDNRNQQDYIVRVGDPIGLIYGWKTNGYYTTADFSGYDAATNTYTLKEGVPTTALLGGAIGIRPGTIKLQDTNGDGVVDTKDIGVIGDTNPDFSGGFGLSGTVYDFDFNANFTFTVGNDIYNANKIASSQRYRSGSYPNMLNTMNQSNSYSYMNPETGELMTSLEDLAKWNEGSRLKEYWSPFSFGDAVVMPTDWAIEKASFLRLQSLTIGYTLPKTITKKFGVERLRFYVTGSNLFVITNYSGYDPEVSSYARNSSYSGLTPGIDYSSYPKSRAFTFGVNLTL